MPRKFYINKNRYCISSKLSEGIFGLLLFEYLSLKTASETVKLIEECRVNNPEIQSVSLKSVNKYYHAFGEYLYYTFCAHMLRREDVDWFKSLFYSKTINSQELRHHFYECFFPAMQCFHELSRRKNGISEKSFLGDFSLCLCRSMKFRESSVEFYKKHAGMEIDTTELLMHVFLLERLRFHPLDFNEKKFGAREWYDDEVSPAITPG